MDPLEERQLASVDGDRLRPDAVLPDVITLAAPVVGVIIETPASALCATEICETGVDFVSFGTNDLTQYTLAVDRTNEVVADRYDALHPAVLRLIQETIETCRAHDVATSICGQAASDPTMIEELINAGITSISVNVDAVHDAQQKTARVEQHLVLESVRN